MSEDKKLYMCSYNFNDESRKWLHIEFPVMTSIPQNVAIFQASPGYTITLILVDKLPILFYAYVKSLCLLFYIHSYLVDQKQQNDKSVIKSYNFNVVLDFVVDADLKLRCLLKQDNA